MGQDKGNGLYVQILYCPVEGLCGSVLSVSLVVLKVFLSVPACVCVFVCVFLYIYQSTKINCLNMMSRNYVLDVYATQYISIQYIL